MILAVMVFVQGILAVSNPSHQRIWCVHFCRQFSGQPHQQGAQWQQNAVVDSSFECRDLNDVWTVGRRPHARLVIDDDTHAAVDVQVR